MRLSKLSLICVCLFYMLAGKVAWAQDISWQVGLKGKWSKPELPRLNGYQIWNDITGYYDANTHKEYAIAGSTDSIYFLDVSNPANIVLCDVEDGKAHQVVNRDYECYSHYVYCVSDNGNKGSLQIFDLQYLPDSVHKIYDSDSLSYNTHSIFIEHKSKRMYMCINRLKNGGVAAMDIMSLENPERPVWIGRLNVPTFGDGVPVFRNVHEVYVRNDTAYCSVEYKGLWIFDLRDLNKQRLISTITDYPENGYNHTSVLDSSGKYILFTDEIPSGTSIKLFDIHDIYHPQLLSLFRSNQGATAHNPFWLGEFAYVSYYHDGFYIFNLKNKSAPYPVGYYHTSPWPPANYEGYKGCWGIYPWLPSGNVLASDMGEGIYVLKPDPHLTSLKENVKPGNVSVYPNPFQKEIHIETKELEDIELKLFNDKGELILHKKFADPTFDLEMEDLETGMYFAVLQSGNFQIIKKLIKN